MRHFFRGSAALALLVLSSSVADARTPPPVVSGAAAPAQVNPGDSVLLTVTIAAGTPTNATFVVSADLRAIQGEQFASFSDSGTNGDVVPGDRVFSRRVTVGAGLGPRTLPVSVNYDDGLSGLGTVSTSISLTIGVPPVF